MEINKNIIFDKINEHTDEGAFKLAFDSISWMLNPEQVMPMFKAIIKQHNELIDKLNESTTSDFVNEAYQKGFNDGAMEASNEIIENTEKVAREIRGVIISGNNSLNIGAPSNKNHSWFLR